MMRQTFIVNLHSEVELNTCILYCRKLIMDINNIYYSNDTKCLFTYYSNYLVKKLEKHYLPGLITFEISERQKLYPLNTYNHYYSKQKQYRRQTCRNYHLNYGKTFICNGTRYINNAYDSLIMSDKKIEQ